MESQRVRHNWVTKYSTAYTRAHTHTYSLLVSCFWRTLMNTSTQGWYWFIFSLYEKVFTCCSSSPYVGKSRKPARVLENTWTLEPDLSPTVTWPYTGQQMNQKPSSPPSFCDYFISKNTSFLSYKYFLHLYKYFLIYVQHFLYYSGLIVIPVFED